MLNLHTHFHLYETNKNSLLWKSSFSTSTAYFQGFNVMNGNSILGKTLLDQRRIKFITTKMILDQILGHKENIYKGYYEDNCENVNLGSNIKQNYCIHVKLFDCATLYCFHIGENTYSLRIYVLSLTTMFYPLQFKKKKKKICVYIYTDTQKHTHTQKEGLRGEGRKRKQEQ